MESNKKMTIFPVNVKEAILKLVPASVINDIACYIFYDNHPRDKNCMDITICTKTGEVKEFYQKDIQYSVYLGSTSRPTEIKIFRNRNAELFYLVRAADELVILSRRENLQIHRKVNNVDRFDVEDTVCRGQACLKVLFKDDAVPLVFDDNFESLSDTTVSFCGVDADDSLPVITQLMRKLNEATYSVKCNENTHKELLSLRQLAAFSRYQNTHLNMDDSIFKSDTNEVEGALKMKTSTPWIKVCNRKIAVICNVANPYSVPLEDVHILLHCTETPSIVYTTKLFENTNSPPFWREKKTQKLKPYSECSVVLVIDLKELKHDVLSRIEFSGVVFYQKLGTEHMLPFDDVVLSSIDTMGEQFDVLSNCLIDEPNTILAILATTVQTELHFRHIKTEEEQDISVADIFCTYLQMEQVPFSDSIVIHRKSPYHTLNGVMVVIEDRCEITSVNNYLISVYTREPSQVLALIHYIHDAVPAKILVTTIQCKITTNIEELSQYYLLIFRI